MRNFNHYVGIDWSGAKAPKITNAIAVARCHRGKTAPTLIACPTSREAVAEWIIAQAQSDQRTLIGIDCNFGYAEAVGLIQFGHHYNYRDLWGAVNRSSHDQNNFFAGGYWQNNPHFWTQGKKPDGFAMPQRLTEKACGQAGFGWPESPFKLIGAKQVGKGGLAGMRMAIYLKETLGARIAFWPFESDCDYDAATIVMTEIYPRQFIRRAHMGHKKIRTSDALSECLNQMGSQPYTDGAITDHITDALISAAGLRHLCGQDKLIPNHISQPVGLSPELAAREGWIFGIEGITKPC